MKRSEMIEIINEAFKKSDYDAEGVLNLVEKAGMLPPPTDIEYGVTRRLCYVEYDYLDMGDSKPVSMWEPEDE